MFGNKKEPLGKHGAPAAGGASEKAPQASGEATPTPHVGSYYAGVNAAVAAERPRGKKIAAIVLGSIAGVLVAAYLIGIVVFSNVFYPRTALGAADISLKPVSEVADIASDIGSNYKIKVTGDGLNFTVDSSAANVKVDGGDVASAAISDNQPWKWPYEIFQDHDETANMASTFDSAGLDAVVGQYVDAFNATATDPVNATVTFSAVDKAFVVAPASVGTKVDSAAVFDAVATAIATMDSSVSLTEAQLVQPTVFQDNPKLIAAAETANGYLKADFQLVLGDTAIPIQEVGPAQIAQWVTIDENLAVAFDEEQMNAWTEELANSVYTVGKERTFTGVNGATYTVSGGTYGWDINTESLLEEVEAAVAAGQTEPLTIPTNQEGYTWNGQNGIDWGPHAEVSLSEQHAWFVDAAGNVLWESDVVTGRPDAKHSTPTGVWRVLNKATNYTLTGDVQASTGQPEYRTKVAFWMPFTYSGCGFHDATWQSAFGGTRYADGYGSHGCVNLPYNAASSLFDVISVNNAVIVHE